MSKSGYRVESDDAREWFKDAIARRNKGLAVSDKCFKLSEVLNVDNRGFYTKSREGRGLWAFPFVKVAANGDIFSRSERGRGTHTSTRQMQFEIASG